MGRLLGQVSPVERSRPRSTAHNPVKTHPSTVTGAQGSTGPILTDPHRLPNCKTLISHVARANSSRIMGKTKALAGARNPDRFAPGGIANRKALRRRDFSGSEKSGRSTCRASLGDEFRTPRGQVTPQWTAQPAHFPGPSPEAFPRCRKRAIRLLTHPRKVT